MADFDPSFFPATCTCGVLAGWLHAFGCATNARRDDAHVGFDPASGPDRSAVIGAGCLVLHDDDTLISDCGEPTGDPKRAAAFWTITEDVRALCQSSRRRFWGELASLVECEYDCPPGYDRTAWAMEHATAGMVETAYRRVEG